MRAMIIWTYSYPPRTYSFLYTVSPCLVSTRGFIGDTTEELWTDGCNYRLSFHSIATKQIQGALSQEPYAGLLWLEASKTAMAIRYALLPYMLYFVLISPHHWFNCHARSSLGFSNDPGLSGDDRPVHSLRDLPSWSYLFLIKALLTVNGVFSGARDGQVCVRLVLTYPRSGHVPTSKHNH